MSSISKERRRVAITPDDASSTALESMLANDSEHHERVEQQLEFLSSTRPNRGRSRSVRVDPQRDEQEGQR